MVAVETIDRKGAVVNGLDRKKSDSAGQVRPDTKAVIVSVRPSTY